MSEGLFAPLEGSLCLLGAILIVLHLFLAQYFEPWIVYVFSFPVEIHLWQRKHHRKANTDAFSILWYQFRVLFSLLGVGSCVGWLHSWDILSTTKFAPRCTRSEPWNKCVMHTKCPALWTVLSVSAKSCLEACRSWGAWWFWKIKAGPFCVHLPTKTHKLNLEPRNCRNSSLYIPSSRLHLLSLFLPYYTHRQHPDLDITWLAQMLRGFLIPIINTKFIELSTTTYLMISFFPRVVLRFNLFHRYTRGCQIKSLPQSISFV